MFSEQTTFANALMGVSEMNAVFPALKLLAFKLSCGKAVIVQKSYELLHQLFLDILHQVIVLHRSGNLITKCSFT